jgi:hypothetical protein
MNAETSCRPFAKGELGRLADDIAECAEQLDLGLRVSQSVRPGAQKKQANWVRLVHHLPGQPHIRQGRPERLRT